MDLIKKVNSKEISEMEFVQKANSNIKHGLVLPQIFYHIFCQHSPSLLDFKTSTRTYKSVNFRANDNNKHLTLYGPVWESFIEDHSIKGGWFLQIYMNTQTRHVCVNVFDDDGSPQYVFDYTSGVFSPRFLEEVYYNTRTYLQLPPTFVDGLNFTIGSTQTLVANGQLYHVEVVKFQGSTVVLTGKEWERLYDDNKLNEGNFLLFEHMFGEYFCVEVFANHGVRKGTQSDAKYLMQENGSVVIKSSFDVDKDLFVKDVTLSKTSPQRNIIAASDPIEDDYCRFVKPLDKHVIRRFALTIPAYFVRRFNLHTASHARLRFRNTRFSMKLLTLIDKRVKKKEPSGHVVIGGHWGKIQVAMSVPDGYMMTFVLDHVEETDNSLCAVFTLT